MLVLDQFVEEDLFGEVFGQLFLKTINEMLQTTFSCLLTAPVRHNIEESIEEYVRWKQSRKSTSKE